MLRSAHGQQQAHATKRSWNVVVFSVGGLKLAARTEDVGSVSPWTESIPVPSQDSLRASHAEAWIIVSCPSMIWRRRLSSQLQGDLLLCLEARHVDGPMAICIDADVPSLETVDVTAIRPYGREDIETLGMVTIGGEDVAIVALQRLGRSRQDAVRS